MMWRQEKIVATPIGDGTWLVKRSLTENSAHYARQATRGPPFLGVVCRMIDEI